MYCLSEQQIDYILNDISARGVKLESLQLNLLDHVCCIIEQNLEADGDFEAFYERTIKTFYKSELREIEVEAINLLTYKNYYVMKKIMIISGSISTLLLCLGIVFKFEHMAGASFFLVTGISFFSLIFLPLVFTLKAKENQNVKDKLVIGLGTLAGILFSMGILFKVMHWPLANVMAVVALVIMLILFLPIYFFSGIRNAERKINTIVSSVLIIAVCGLFLALVRSPAGTRIQQLTEYSQFVRNQQILKTEQILLAHETKGETYNQEAAVLANKINALCEELKERILMGETGQKSIDNEYENQNTLLSDDWAWKYLEDGTDGNAKLEELKATIIKYNKVATDMNNNLQSLPIKLTVLEMRDKRIPNALNDFIQIQMLVTQNGRQLASLK